MLCFLCACFGNAYQKITPEAAYQMMQTLNDFVLLDVRSAAEFQEKHIYGATLIPVNELERRAESELPDKNRVIFVYCRAGVRSRNAANILLGKGYTQVFDIGGIMDWPYKTVSN